MIEFYTDGSCIGNPGPGSRGWICYEDGKEIAHGRGKSQMTTNNQMELQAATNALQAIKNMRVEFRDQRSEIGNEGDTSSLKSLDSDLFTICTDSSYVYEGVTKYLPSWKKKGRRLANKRPLKNLEQWIALDKLLQSGVSVQRKRVRGHADDMRNKQVDRMLRR